MVTVFSGDGESGGNGEAEAGHFRHVGSFAAQEIFHLLRAFFKRVDELFHVVIVIVFLIEKNLPQVGVRVKILFKWWTNELTPFGTTCHLPLGRGRLKFLWTKGFV